MAETIEGIYAGYFSGQTAASIAMFVILDGAIAAADAGGGIYSGEYSLADDGRNIEGTLLLKAASGSMLITGMIVGDVGIEMKIPFKLPVPIDEQRVFEFQTPVGQVNGKLKLIRRLP